MSDQAIIDKLFRVSECREFVVHGKKVKLFVRTLGSAANAHRENYALARTRALLARIKREGSPENEMFMLAPHDEARDELLARALLMKTGGLAYEIAKDMVPADTPEAPDDPTLTEIVEAEDAAEAARIDMLDNAKATAKARAEEIKAELEAMDDIQLIEEVVKLTIDGALSAEFNRQSNFATLYNAVFTDKGMTKRYFDSPEEASEADPEFVDMLLGCYSELDVFFLKQEDLKN